MMTRDSVRVMAQVWELDLPEAQKFVLLAFADHANDDGLCFPSIPRIAWKCGFSVRQVQRITAILRKVGLLSAPKGISRGGFSSHTTHYQVCPERGDKLSPFVPGGGDKRSGHGVTSATRTGDTHVTRIIKNRHSQSVAARNNRARHIDDPVENSERQSISLKSVAERMHPVPAWVHGELAESLYRGVHSQKIAAIFFDSKSLSPEEQLADCVRVAVATLVTNRVATLKRLDAGRVERLSFDELRNGLVTLRNVKNFEDRKRETVRAVTRVVVQTCIRLLEVAA